MWGLFVRHHAEVTATISRVSVLYVHAISPGTVEESHRKKFDIETDDNNGVLTVRLYYHAPRFEFLGKIVAPWLFIRAIAKGYHIIKQLHDRPDIIHVHVLTRPGVIALWFHVMHGIPYVITEHWSRYLPEVNAYHGVIRKVMTRLVVRCACAVTTPAENLKQAMQSRGLKNKHYMILPNVVDTDRFVPSVINTTQADRHMDRKIKFVHVSCFEDQSKNITGTLNVLKRLSIERQDWECHMVGDGTDRERMMRLAEQLGLDNMVRFTGLLEGEVLVEAIRSSAFMILFSRYETFSVVIREAFACGLPVVATAVGGITEAMSNERGILVKPGDEEDMLEAVKWMLDHYIDYNREKIRAYAVANFGKEMVRRKLEELYQMVGGNL